MAAARGVPAKSQAQIIAESTWDSYSQLLCKGDAGILKLYVRAKCSKPRGNAEIDRSKPFTPVCLLRQKML
jgi:hypothetical protein